MKPSDVTDEMVQHFKKNACLETGCCTYQEQIAAAHNAIHHDDSEPITAEWLISLPGVINIRDQQWSCTVSPDASLTIYQGRSWFVQVKFASSSEAIHREIKTRSEVLSWHVVLGRPLR